METDILYLNPPDQNPLQTFTQILCFPSVDNGFNNEKNISCLCKLHLNSHKKTGKEILELRVPIEKDVFFVLSQAWDKRKLLSPKRNQTSDIQIPLVLSEAWDKRKILSPKRNQTSDIQIPHSDALSLSNRGSIVSKAHHETHI